MGGLYSKVPRFTLIAAVYALILTLPYAPFLQGKVFYQADIFIYFEPMWRFITQSISFKQLPVWNPTALCGMPQLAVSSPSPFYPLNLPFLILPFSVALPIVLFLHQWLFACLTYLFLRENQLRMPAAFTGGVIAGLNGYMFGSSQCYTLAATMSWTPMGLIAIWRSSQNPAWLALLSVALALQIYAGRPELYVAIALIYVAALLMPRNGQRSRRNPGKIWALVLTLGLGFGLAAPSLLPLAELYLQSPRVSGLNYQEVVRWSAGWFDWLQLIVVAPFGDLSTGKYHLNPETPGLQPYITSLYVGSLALSLAVVGWTVLSRSQRLVWGGGFLLFFLLAAGSHGFLLPWLFNVAPQLVVFRYPIKLAVIPLFLIAISAAYGVQAVAEGKLSRGLLNTLIFLWCLCFASGALLFLPPSASMLARLIWTDASIAGGLEAVRQTASQIVVASVIALVGLVLARNYCVVSRGEADTVEADASATKKRTTSVLAISAMIAVSLCLSGSSELGPVAGSDFFSHGSPVGDWIKQHATGPEPSRLLVLLPEDLLSPQSYWRPEDLNAHSILLSQYQREMLVPNSNADFGLEETYGFSPTETGPFRILFLGVTTRSSLYSGKESGFSTSDVPLWRYCQVTNTRFLLTTNNRPDPVSRFVGNLPLLDQNMFHLVQVFPKLNARLYEVKDWLPRAVFRSSCHFAASRTIAMKQIFFADESQFDPHKSAIIAGSEPTRTPTHSQPDRSGNPENGKLVQPEYPSAPLPPKKIPSSNAYSDSKLRSFVADTGNEVSVLLSQEAPDRIAVRLTAPCDGYVVLSVLKYPGWQVVDNGRAAELLEANALFQAVHVRPGEHRIVFYYQSRAFFLGCVCFLVALLLLCLYVVWAIRLGKRIKQQ